MEISRQNLFAIRLNISLGIRTVLTPESVTDACTNDEIQIKNRYAKKTGTAGDTWCEKYGPLNDISATFSPPELFMRRDSRVNKEEDGR